MRSYLTTLLTLPLLLWASGCVYDLDVEGKMCNSSSHICPSGYFCSLDGGEGVCKVGTKTDGGDEDAGDQPSCVGNEKDCLQTDLSKILVCDLGKWVEDDCGTGTYCTDFGNQKPAACEPDCSSSEDCTKDGTVTGFYCNTDTNHCEPQGDCNQTMPVDVPQCNATRTKVVICRDVSFIEEELDECQQPQEYCDIALAECRARCTDDSGCQPWPQESCNLSTGICERIFLCTGNADCSRQEAPTPVSIQNKCIGGVCECTQGVCVVKPTEQATTAVGLDLSCFPDATDPPATPATCDLEGNVVWVVNNMPVDYTSDLETYLEVRAHLLPDILGGDNDNPQAVTTVTEDTNSHCLYRLVNLPTNTELVLEVGCNASVGAACPYNHHTYTFNIYLRADDCSTAGGTLSLAAPSIPDSLWPGYASVGGAEDSSRGVVFGNIGDCVPNDLLQGTGDITMPYTSFGLSKAVYYPPFGGPPDENVTSTVSTGYFGASNVAPIRGLASALVLDQGLLVWLRTYPIRVFPQAASLVFFEKPKVPQYPLAR